MDVVLVPIHLGMHWCLAVRKFTIKPFIPVLVTNVAFFSQFRSSDKAYQIMQLNKIRYSLEDRFGLCSHLANNFVLTGNLVKPFFIRTTTINNGGISAAFSNVRECFRTFTFGWTAELWEWIRRREDVMIWIFRHDYLALFRLFDSTWSVQVKL